MQCIVKWKALSGEVFFSQSFLLFLLFTLVDIVPSLFLWWSLRSSRHARWPCSTSGPWCQSLSPKDSLSLRTGPCSPIQLQTQCPRRSFYPFFSYINGPPNNSHLRNTNGWTWILSNVPKSVTHIFKHYNAFYSVLVYIQFYRILPAQAILGCESGLWQNNHRSPESPEQTSLQPSVILQIGRPCLFLT